MSAAEYKFPDPPDDQPQWLALAQAVFNTQAARWDMEHCNGGLRWQIFTFNNGYNYKNSISQGCFFNLAARLALYSGNESYADWADKTWDWMREVKLIDDSYNIYDGGVVEQDCTKLVPYQFTYNAGVFLLGAAAMYNHTTGDEREKWRGRVDGLLNATKVFFTGNQSNIMTEVACEPVNKCDNDMQSFKAYLSRWMAATTKWAPWTYDKIRPLLESSAVAATSQCTGGDNGRMCGLRWTDGGKWDGSTGPGQQMAAMEVVLANLIEHGSAPVTSDAGGTSRGDAGAGGSDIGSMDPWARLDREEPIRTADRAGAGILTAAVVVSLVALVVFMMMDEDPDEAPAAAGSNLEQIFAHVTGRTAMMRRRGIEAGGIEEGKNVDPSDSSDRSSVLPKTAVIARHATGDDTTGITPLNQGAYAPRRLNKTRRRSVASDPGVPPPGDGWLGRSEGALPPSHRRSQSVVVAKRKSLRKKALQRPVAV